MSATAVERGRREVKAWMGLRARRVRPIRWRIAMATAAPVVESLVCDGLGFGGRDETSVHFGRREREYRGGHRPTIEACIS